MPLLPGCGGKGSFCPYDRALSTADTWSGSASWGPEGSRCATTLRPRAHAQASFRCWGGGSCQSSFVGRDTTCLGSPHEGPRLFCLSLSLSGPGPSLPPPPPCYQTLAAAIAGWRWTPITTACLPSAARSRAAPRRPHALHCATGAASSTSSLVSRDGKGTLPTFVTPLGAVKSVAYSPGSRVALRRPIRSASSL